jgi:copper transport protein
VLSDPVAGVALGDTPTAIRLTFTEKPEASLSVIRVLDTNGAQRQLGPVEPFAGDLLSLTVRVRRLGHGVYTVTWRVVSAVDGHATAGAYAFGVGVSPTGAATPASSTIPVASRLEMLGRWILLVGLVALLGAAVASVARFGGGARDALKLGAGGWLLAVVGLVLLVDAQRRSAHASLDELFNTSVGRDLIWRGVAIGAAGGSLLLARRAPRRFRKVAMPAAALAALAAMAIHVAAGHAASGAWPRTVSVAFQWAHFAAAGIWIGGLATLLLGLRGAPSAGKAAAVRRFSWFAVGGLVVLGATAIARAVEELSAWGDLVHTGYGRAVLAKGALLLAIAGVAVVNRRRGVPAAATDLGLLRRLSRVELVLAAGALALAAVLGSLAPPASRRSVAPLGLTLSGTDVRSAVQVRLTVASAQPGPNRFVLHAVDVGSKTPVQAGHASLRFTPLDDPGVASTSLELGLGPDYSFVGSGANVVFDGRWRVTAVIERAGGAVRVPLELDAQGPTQFISVERVPGRAPKYTVEVGTAGFVRISPHPERAGRSTLYVTCYDVFGNMSPVRHLVLTAAAKDGPPRRHSVRRVGTGFAAVVELRAAKNTIAVVARTTDGRRLRAAVELDVPSG